MSARNQRAWLFGPVPDLLLGAGLLYLVIISALVASGAGVLAAFPRSWFAYLVLVISGSHYGATLLRVYEHESERRVYRVFTIYGTLAIVAALLGALHSPIFGSFLITLYLTWSPWHYTGQNYGIATMFLRRRGVEISPLAKRLLHASFVLSFVSVFLNFHFEGGVSQGDPLGYTSLASSGFQFVSLGLPGTMRTWLMPIVGFGYLSTLTGTSFLLLRSNELRAVAPAAIVVLTQAVWFSIPHMGFYFDLGASVPAFNPRAGENFRFYFFWTAIGHAAQYLWITAYYARSDERWQGYTNYLSKTFVVGNAVWAAPVLLFGPGLIGRPDYDSGLAMCVAAAVNLHHFVLDGAIWKLRNPRIAGILLRARRDGNGALATRRTTTWKTRVAWVLVGLFCVAKVAPYVELDVRLPTALRKADFPTAESILDRAALYGRDSANLRTVLANRLVSARRPAQSLRHYRRSLELRPDAHGFAELGRLVGKLEGREAALSAWNRGLDIFPNDGDLNRLMGVDLMRAGRAREALPHLERAAMHQPGDEEVRKALAEARRRLAS